MNNLTKYGINAEHDAVLKGSKNACMHEHNVYELYFLVSGKRRYLMRHTVYDVEPGNLLLIPPGLLHRVTSASQTGYNRYALYFSKQHAQWINELLGKEAFESLVGSGCLKFPGHISRQIQSDLEQIFRELQDPSPVAKAVMTHLLHGILLNAMRYGTKKARLEGATADKIQSITKYISENYREEISLAMAAEMTHIERTYFSKRFKSVTGFGFQEYLLETRLSAAQNLLLNTDLSISDISDQCGFSSCNYFGDVFRRNYGVSPSDYRKNVGQ